MRKLLCIGGAALSLGACGESDTPAPQAPAGQAVTIKTFIFSPKTITVEPGTEVTFENLDQTRHTVTSGDREQPDGRFDEELGAGAKASVAFDRTGRYEYVCTRHQGPGMEGLVVVR